MHENGFCFNWPKPRFTARERGFGPEELILVATGPMPKPRFSAQEKGFAYAALGGTEVGHRLVS